MTKGGHAQIEDISLDAGVPAQIVYRIVRENSERDILNLEGKTVIMNRSND